MRYAKVTFVLSFLPQSWCWYNQRSNEQLQASGLLRLPATRCQVLISTSKIPVMVGSGLDANYQSQVPENVAKMFHLSPECRSCISPRYLAGNPPCCQYWSMSEACREKDGTGRMDTPALGSRAWAQLVWHQLTACWETPPQRYHFHLSLGTIAENQGF